MTTTRADSHTAVLGAYLGVVQFFFATTWTIYVVYLPQLVAQSGLDKSWVPWILVADQVVFALADVATGFWIDRVRAGLARFGGWILAIATVSCAAFLLLPFAAPLAGTQVLFFLLAVWTVTSSALRSPPWALLSRYAATPSLPSLSALVLAGTGVASALAPYLGIALRGVDPRLPFVLSSITLIATVAGLVAIERRLARSDSAPAGESEPAFDWSARGTSVLAIVFFACVVVLAAGFQVHFAMNSASQYLRVARPDQLQWLMPVFWVGYSVLAFPLSALVEHRGAIPVLTAATVSGALASFAAAKAGGLTSLVIAQLAAGGCWAGINVAAFTLAIALGRTGREGTMLGLLFSTFAIAAFARILLVATGIAALPEFKILAPWLPEVLWALAAALMLVALAGVTRGRLTSEPRIAR